jgi:PEP-CTERM motif
VGVVPEPGTWVMFASGLAFFGWQARRKLVRG